jgi:hypothetical protein
VGGHGCGHGAGHGFAGLHSGFAQAFALPLFCAIAGLAFDCTSAAWPNTEVATRNDATIHGFVFFSIFSIFCSPFWTNSFVFFSFR